jgi:hypothetical protein
LNENVSASAAVENAPNAVPALTAAANATFAAILVIKLTLSSFDKTEREADHRADKAGCGDAFGAAPSMILGGVGFAGLDEGEQPLGWERN